MSKLIKQAFTLIELLVVIAIIGILSGLIVVAMGGITDKANIAKAQVFSNSLRNSLMLNLVSEWKLDENAGTTTADFWSGGNTGTLTGPTHLPTWKTGTDCVSGSCVQFDGIDDYINIINNSNLHFSTNFTIEAWVNISVVPVSADCMILGDYNGAYKGYKFSIDNNRKVFIQIGRQSDSTVSGLVSTQQLDLNKWYQVAVSYDGKTNVFVNGQKTIGNAYAPIEAETSNILMGKAQWYAKYFQGLIDNVRVYNAAVPLSQIRENYYVGLNQLFLKGSISKDEYFSMISSIAEAE